MDAEQIRDFRSILRAFEREVYLQVNSSLCSGVTVAQCHALLEIEHLNESTIGDLARVTSLDKSTVSRTVDGLVNIGLVDRSIPATNRRTSLIKLTGQGKEVCSQINEKNDWFFSETLSGFKKVEVESFLKIFEKITKKMKVVNKSLKEKNEIK